MQKIIEMKSQSTRTRHAATAMSFAPFFYVFICFIFCGEGVLIRHIHTPVCAVQRFLLEICG